MKEFYYKITTFEQFQEMLRRHQSDKWNTLDWNKTTSKKGGCFRIKANVIDGWNYHEQETDYQIRNIPRKSIFLFNTYLKEIENEL